MVGYVNLNSVVRLVCRCNHDISSGESVEVGEHPSLDVLLLPHFVLLAGFNQLGDVLIHIVGCIKSCSPQWSAIEGIVSSVERLLCSVVDNRDSFSEQRESKRCFKHLLVSIQVQESRVVVVINKSAEDGTIRERLLLLISVSSD